MNKIIITLLLLVSIVSTSQADLSQWFSRDLGGTSKIDLPAGKKLEIVTWKESSLWFLMRDRRPGEPIEQHYFKESSAIGVLQGTVIINEH